MVAGEWGGNGFVGARDEKHGNSRFPKPDAAVAESNADATMTTTSLPLTKIKRVRKRAADAAHSEIESPEGWSKSMVDPMGVLASFKPLRIKNGYVLRAYQFRAGGTGNGNGFVWAVPADEPFPEPDECPKLEGVFLAPPKPPAALNDLMKAIDGDGAPWSYLCASLFCREIDEFGAMWHGCSWGTHGILDKNPLKARRSRQHGFDRPFGAAGEWSWAEPEPTEWKPQVVEEGDSISVVFLTFGGHDVETIYRHTDRFTRGSYSFKTERSEIATGPGDSCFERDWSNKHAATA
jgi:hypothetical protein